MGRDPKPERTREEREPPGPMLRGKATLSVSFIIAPRLGPQSPALCPAPGQCSETGAPVQQEKTRRRL